jgi:hypothetical protein
MSTIQSGKRRVTVTSSAFPRVLAQSRPVCVCVQDFSSTRGVCGKVQFGGDWRCLAYGLTCLLSALVPPARLNASVPRAESLRAKRSGYCQRSRGEDANRDCKKERDFEHSPRLVAGHMRPRSLHESSMSRVLR